MARRRFSDRMQSATATWASRLAIFALVVAVLSVIVIRSELLEIGPSLATFGAALAFACLAIVLALASFVGIWRHGQTGLGSALLALLLGGALLPYPAYLAYRGYKTPAMTDVTTSPADPPRFDVIARLRERGNERPVPVSETQRATIADLEPLQLQASAQVAYDAALAVVAKRKWRVVDARAPIAGRREGTIEAVARSPIMGFRDDVVIRVRSAAANGARIDIRSSARHPFLDFGGENAVRVRALIDEIDEATSAMQARLEKEAERAAEKAAATPAKRQPPARR